MPFAQIYRTLEINQLNTIVVVLEIHEIAKNWLVSSSFIFKDIRHLNPKVTGRFFIHAF